MKSVNVIIERGNNGRFSAYMQAPEDLDYGVIGTGGTAQQAKDDILASLDEMRQFYKEEGKPFTEVDLHFSYDTASFLSYYSKVLSLAGLQRVTGINQGQLSHYITGRRRPSVRTVKKIEKAMHDFAHDLSQVNFV